MTVEGETRNEDVTVGVGPTVICPPAPRVNIYVKNISPGAQVVTVMLGDKDTAQGIRLAVGEWYQDSSGDVYQCWQGKILGRGTDAAAKVGIMER